jgi:hypothetical protein
MESLLGRERAQFLPDMADRGLIFLNPESALWETADAYLSGNVRNKLDMADVAGDDYLRNVMALKAVIPADLGPGEIDARIGSTWIPSRDYAHSSIIFWNARVARWSSVPRPVHGTSMCRGQANGRSHRPKPTARVA